MQNTWVRSGCRLEIAWTDRAFSARPSAARAVAWSAVEGIREVDAASTRIPERSRSLETRVSACVLQVSSWIQSEFQVQRELHAAGADVPAALSQIGNAILMGWIGDADSPAPRLSDVDLDLLEAPALFDQLMDNIARFLANHRIHGDLSAYNILYWQGDITVIDFAQMVDPRYNPDVYPLLERDIERVCSHFARYGIAADPATLAADLWARYLMGDLEVPHQ